MLGQEVATLINKDLQAGSYTVDFDARDLSSGMYIYTIKNGDFEVSKKMMLIFLKPGDLKSSGFLLSCTLQDS